jgi:uncharacterized membrane protein
MLFCFPSKKINGIYGYRTPSSMKNEKNWAIANKYSSKLLIGFGLLLLIIGAISKHILITLAFTVIFSLIIFVLVVLHYKGLRKLLSGLLKALLSKSASDANNGGSIVTQERLRPNQSSHQRPWESDLAETIDATHL